MKYFIALLALISSVAFAQVSKPIVCPDSGQGCVFYCNDGGTLSPCGSIGAGGVWTLEDRLTIQPGTAGNPGLRFDGDEDTGIFRAGEDNLGFTIGGDHWLTMGGNGLYSREAFYFYKTSQEVAASGTYDIDVSNNSVLLATATRIYWAHNQNCSYIIHMQTDSRQFTQLNSEGCTFSDVDADTIRFTNTSGSTYTWRLSVIRLY